MDSWNAWKVKPLHPLNPRILEPCFGVIFMPPNPLLIRYASLLTAADLEGPILDLACGEGQNGLFLAGLGLPVILADRSEDALESAKSTAKGKGA